MNTHKREELTDWDAVLHAAHPYLTALLDTQRSPTTRPVMSEDDALRRRALAARDVPEGGASIDELLTEIMDTVLERGYCNGAHPQYFGYFHPRPLPIAVLGDSISSLLNQSPAAWRMGTAATAMEIEALAWVADFIGYPPTPGTSTVRGLFTSGGSIANLSALKLARDRAFRSEVQSHGVGAGFSNGTVYASAERHYSIPRALDIIGLGRQSMRTIPTDRLGRIRIDALEARLVEDVRSGFRPVAIVGLAGATATGAVDSLYELAEIAEKYDAWFHVDGAGAAVFGNLPDTNAGFGGLERADSITLDPHKWLFLSYGLGCLLLRDSASLDTSFGDEAHYWGHDEREDFVFRGIEGARPWKSLGLWLALRHLGRDGYSDLLLGNLATARHLARRVQETDHLELLTEPDVPVCCFRAIPHRSAIDINDFNQKLQQEIIKDGSFYVTTCEPGGETYIRVAINNYATGPEHVDALIDAVRAAREVVSH